MSGIGLGLMVFAAGGSFLTKSGARAAPGSAADPVRVTQTPDGGILPQAVTDRSGALHLVYFTGKPGNGDFYYVQRRSAGEPFSAPLRVNSQAGSGIATGTIRGAQLALGKGGSVHVVWNGSDSAGPRGPRNPDLPPNSPYSGTPLLYARLNAGGTAFEPQVNVMTRTWGLDGGCSVTADDAGRAYIFWHAADGRGIKGEEGRRLWLARSVDDGKTFAPEVPASPEPTGACACCSVRSDAENSGSVMALYRACTDHTHRDTVLTFSADAGKSWKSRKLQPWEINACPMSSYAFARTGKDLVGAWETEGQVYFAHVDPKTGAVGAPIPAPGPTRGRKHPTLAANSRGELLLAWTEGTGWQKGGALAWQVFDAQNRPTGPSGRLERGIPVWSLATAITRADGGFEIIH